MMGQKVRNFRKHDRVCLDDLVPANHFYRQLEEKVDLRFVYGLVEAKYCWWNGRPSIDPIVFFKLQLILFFEGIRSERQLMEQVKMNLAFRWYIGYDLDEPVPSAAALSRLRDRYGLEVFIGFFEGIIEQCMEAGLVWGKEQHFDATMVEANASYDRQVPRFYWEAMQRHVQTLFGKTGSIATRLVEKYNAQQPPNRYSGYQRKRDYWVNPVDPDPTPADHRKMGYRLHYMVDGGRARIILGCLVTPSATQDPAPMLDMAWLARFRWQLSFERAVADTRYGTTANILALYQNGVMPYIPLLTEAAQHRQAGQRFPLSLFHYDSQRDVYLCPQGETLHYSHILPSTQRRFYKPKAGICAQCPQRSQCTTSPTGRLVSHSAYKAEIDRIVAQRDPALFDKLVRKRQVWIEPKFGEVKQWHHGRRFRLRGIEKVNMEALLRAAGQNLKPLLKRHQSRLCPPPAPTVLLPLPFDARSLPDGMRVYVWN